MNMHSPPGLPAETKPAETKGRRPARHKKPPTTTRVLIKVLIIALALTGFGVGLNAWLDSIGGSSKPAVTAPHHPSPSPTASRPSVKPAAPYKPVQAHTVVHWTVRAGDTLWLIALHHSGHGLNWHRLYQINRHTIGPDPNMLHPGEVLNL
jgi:hypothetical protein